jgi:hypothetical protein
MRELTSDSLARIASLALERTAFLMAETAEGTRARALAAPDRFARIRYRGPEDGDVTLAASDGFLRQLAAGILGSDPLQIDPAAAGAEALRELANIVAGSLLGEIGGSQCPYVLGLPAACSAADAAAGGIVATLEADGERLEIRWRRGQAA